MKSDETRAISNDENMYLSNEETHTIDNESESTIVDPENRNDEPEEAPEQPKSEKKFDTSNIAFAAGGAVIGAAAGAGVSAMAADKSDVPADENPEDEAATDSEITDNGEAPSDTIQTDEQLLKGEEIDTPSDSTLTDPETITPEQPAAEPVNVNPQPVEPEATTVQPQQVNVTVNINGVPVEDVEKEAEVVVSEPEVSINAIGSVMDEHGNIVNMVDVTVDDTAARFVDLDNDHIADAVIVDANGNNIVDEQDIIMDVTDQNIDLDDMAQSMVDNME